MTAIQQAACAVAHAPIALEAIAHHAMQHKLLAPHTITLPSATEPELTLFLHDMGAEKWLASVVIDGQTVEEVRPGVQRCIAAVRLPDTGIRVSLRFLRLTITEVSAC